MLTLENSLKQWYDDGAWIEELTVGYNMQRH